MTPRLTLFALAALFSQEALAQLHLAQHDETCLLQHWKVAEAGGRQHQKDEFADDVSAKRRARRSRVRKAPLVFLETRPAALNLAKPALKQPTLGSLAPGTRLHLVTPPPAITYGLPPEPAAVAMVQTTLSPPLGYELQVATARTPKAPPIAHLHRVTPPPAKTGALTPELEQAPMAATALSLAPELAAASAAATDTAMTPELAGVRQRAPNATKAATRSLQPPVQPSNVPPPPPGQVTAQDGTLAKSVAERLSEEHKIRDGQGNVIIRMGVTDADQDAEQEAMDALNPNSTPVTTTVSAQYLPNLEEEIAEEEANVARETYLTAKQQADKVQAQAKEEGEKTADLMKSMSQFAEWQKASDTLQDEVNKEIEKQAKGSNDALSMGNEQGIAATDSTGAEVKNAYAAMAEEGRDALKVFNADAQAVTVPGLGKWTWSEG